MADLGDRGLHRSERGERGAADTAKLLRRHIWNIHVENDRALNAEQQSECLTRNSFRRDAVVIGHQSGDGHVGRARDASGASPRCSTVTVNNGDGATTTTTHPI